jgi:hypothetical protein
VKLHSPHPPVSPDPLEARARATKHRCFATLETWPALPWTTEELVGTQWINVHTCGVVTIEEVATAKPRINEGYNRIGFVYQGKLIVEHWVRWDVLAPPAQLAWCSERIIRLQTDIAYQRNKLSQKEMDGSERTYRKWELERTEQRLVAATAQARQLAQAHGLPFEAARLTNQVALLQSAPAQLALFSGEAL